MNGASTRGYHCVLAAVFLVASLAPGSSTAQIAGENVNMVSGTKLPNGDPYLQRQNEPSMAVSSANPDHLLAGANDYRTVDIPNAVTGEKVGGDAWLGVFRSNNAGQTWQSTLLPGYPQSSACVNSTTLKLVTPLDPLCRFDVPKGAAAGTTPIDCSATIGDPNQGCAAADPVVRAGPDGMIYYNGIQFTRDHKRSRVFLARFVDLNHKENGDVLGGAVRYLDTKIIATAPAGVFIDKPWVAIDKPRGAQTCTINAGSGPQTIAAGTIYVAWAQFALPDEATSDIMLSYSSDCGATWSAPIKLNSANSKTNQGVAIAIEPITGRVYVTWRRFTFSPSAPATTSTIPTPVDAIMVTRSWGRKKMFALPRAVATLAAFDQPTGGATFRTQSIPTMAISTDGISSWAHVAWSQRTSNGDAKIVTTTAKVYPPPPGDQDDDDPEDQDLETRLTWSPPAPVDPAGNDAGVSFTRGHQSMPALTFGQGRLMLVYYDTRLDHTRRYYQPKDEFLPPFYDELLAPRDELLTGVPVFGPYIDDATMRTLRHTMDVRVARALPGPSPVFRGITASKYPFGLRGDELIQRDGNGAYVKDTNGAYVPVTGAVTVPGFNGSIQIVDSSKNVKVLQQLQLNPPNLPMFRSGTVPFMGDYIDIQGLAFVKDPADGWVPNVAPTSAPVFHAVWTSNQDVRVPVRPDGVVDWTKYTPFSNAAPSQYDLVTTPPQCDLRYVGSRDQNIYTSRITEGLAVTSPQNVKPLGPKDCSGTQCTLRSFVVAAQNTTSGEIVVDFEASGPAGTYSFVNGQPYAALTNITIPKFSTVSRTLFVRSKEIWASLEVTVQQTKCTSSCLGGYVTLNPQVALAPLTNPDNPPANYDVGSQEYYVAQFGPGSVGDPNINSPNINSPNINSPNINSPNINSPNINSPNINSPNINSPNINSNPELAAISNPNINSPNINSATISNPNINSPNINSPNINSSAVSDISYTITNQGNTATSYHVKLVTPDRSQLPKNLRLTLARTYRTPTVVGCGKVNEVEHTEIVASAAVDTTTSSAIVDPRDEIKGAANGDPDNLTFNANPGDEFIYSIRMEAPIETAAKIASQMASPAAAPSAVVDVPGTTYQNANVGYVPPGTAGRTPTSTTLAPPTTSLITCPTGTSPYAATVLPVGATGDVTFYQSGTKYLGVTQVASAQICASLAAGPLVAYYGGDASYAPSTSSPITVEYAPTTTTLTYVASAGGGNVGTATVTVTSATTNVPTGTVTLLRDGIALGDSQLVNGTAVFTVAIPAGASLVAVYSGDAVNRGSRDALQNFMFVTSTTQAPGALGGLAGADGVCQARAQAAGLSGTFKAWLSTTTTDAINRLAGGRGWIRPDGKPFVDRVDDLAAGFLMYPPRLDEFGNDAGTAVSVTATTENGTLSSSGSTCGDYTSMASGTIIGGNPTGGSTIFTHYFSGLSCASSARLYCFGTDRNTMALPQPAVGRRAFVTSNLYSGNVGSSTADTYCQAEAIASRLTATAQLSGQFVAALATSQQAIASRFDSGASSLPWVRVDGIPLAPTAARLFTDPYLQVAVNRNAANTIAYGNWGVWTGASSWTSAGTDATTCKDWTSALYDWTDATKQDTGTGGSSGATVAPALLGYPVPCSSNFLLLCMEK